MIMRPVREGREHRAGFLFVAAAVGVFVSAEQDERERGVFSLIGLI
jgi:hypothetical protein